MLLLAASPVRAFTSNSPGGGGGIIGGTCTGGQVMGGISSAGVPTCVTPSGGSGFPPGSPPQIGGFSALNTSEAETVSGDFTYARAGANSYVATITKLNGVAVGALATLNVGTGLTSSLGNLSLTVPVAIVNGGTGSTAAPVVGQIPVATTTSVFTPTAISGDATLASTGALTVTKTGGVAFTGLATAAIPLSIANGGRGSSTAPTVGQIDVASSTTAFTPVTMSGDATITSLGAITVTKLNGITPGGTCTGSQFVNVISASGVPTCAALPAPAAGSITDAMLANAYSGIGACTGGQFVSTLNRNGAPTCTTPAGGGTVTSVALSGGTTGLTVSGSPIITSGTITLAGTLAVANGGTGATTAGAALTNLGAAPTASPTFTGTMTFPDSSTYSSAGHNNMAGIGIGQAAMAGGIGVTGTGNVNTQAFQAINTNAGNSAQASGGFQNNLSHYGTFGLTGSGYNLTPTIPGDSLYFYNNGANGMEFFNANASPEPIRFFVTSSTIAGQFSAGNGPGGLTLGSPTGGDMGLGTVNATNYYVNGTAISAIYAPLASPTLTGTVTMPDASTITTAGYNTVKAMGIGQAVGADPLDITKNTNGFAAITVLNNSAGTGAAPVVQWNNGTYISQAGLLGTGNTTAGAPIPANTTFLYNAAPGGISIDDNTTAPINFWVNGVRQGQFLTTGLNLASTPTVNGTAIQTTIYWEGGSTGVNYTTSSVTLVAMDTTKFQGSITVPTGFKLIGEFFGNAQQNTAGQGVCFCWYKDGAQYTVIWYVLPSAASVWGNVTMPMVFNGDGVAHTWSVYFGVCTGLGTATVMNASSGEPSALLRIVASN